MSHQDWETRVLNSGGGSGRPSTNKADVTKAQRAGAVETQAKYGAGKNQHATASVSTKKLEDDEDGPPKLKHVSRDQAQAIQQARQAKNLTRKELAQRLSEKESVLADYENGKAIPNQAILGKMERILGVRLRGKNIGEPFGKK